MTELRAACPRFTARGEIHQGKQKQIAGYGTNASLPKGRLTDTPMTVAHVSTKLPCLLLVGGLKSEKRSCYSRDDYCIILSHVG